MGMASMQINDRLSSARTQSRTAGPPVSQHQQIIQILLSIIQRRIHVQSIFTRLARYAFWVLLLTSSMILVGRFVRLPNIPTAIFLFPLMLSAILAVGLAFVRKGSPSAIALYVDKQLNLKERFSTAVELIQRKATDDLSHLQIRDAATICTQTSPSMVVPFTFPPVLKWFPIPILLLVASFAMPRMYELPLPPTVAEQKSIEEAVEDFNRMIGDIDDPVLAKNIQDALKGLKNTDSLAVQNRLSKLRDKVRNQKRPFTKNELDEVSKVFAEVGDESNRFKNMHPGKLAEELDKLANEENLTPELQEELRALFNKIAERLKDNSVAKNFTKEMDELQTQAVSPDTLKKIARQLANMEKLARSRELLEQVLEQIAASRKNIALASLNLEIDRNSGGIANREGGAGDESTTGETRGTIAAADSDFEPRKSVEEAEFGNQLTATETPQSVRKDGPELRLKAPSSGTDTPADTNVYVGSDAPGREGEAEYIPYREVILNAKQEYAEAIGNNRIPVRYQRLIGNYLEAITNP